MRRVFTLFGFALLFVAIPSRAHAWWEFIEEFSGPHRFWGPDIQLRLFCVVGPKDPTQVDQRTKTQSAVPIGVILTLCKYDSSTEKPRLMFDLGARFLTSRRYKGDTNPDFANGETIHFTTLEPALMFPLVSTPKERLRLDYGFGAGVYWFSSEGFQSFNGAFLEPVRFDLRIKVSETWFRAVVVRAGLLHFPAGFDPQAWAGGPDNGRIAAEWVPTYSVSVDIIPKDETRQKRLGIR
jgi:hypothetical protein